MAAHFSLWRLHHCRVPGVEMSPPSNKAKAGHPFHAPVLCRVQACGGHRVRWQGCLRQLPGPGYRFWPLLAPLSSLRLRQNGRHLNRLRGSRRPPRPSNRSSHRPSIERDSTKFRNFTIRRWRRLVTGDALCSTPSEGEPGRGQGEKVVDVNTARP